jgi:hypothetical protein
MTLGLHVLGHERAGEVVRKPFPNSRLCFLPTRVHQLLRLPDNLLSHLLQYNKAQCRILQHTAGDGMSFQASCHLELWSDGCLQ